MLPAKVATVRSDHCWQRSACSTSCCTSRGKRRRQEMLFQSSDHRRTGLNCFVLGLRFLFEFLLFFCRQASVVVRGIGILFIPACLLTLQGRGSSTQGCRFERKHAGFGFLQFSFSFLTLLSAMRLGRTLPSTCIRHPSDALSLLFSVKSCASLLTLLPLPPSSRRQHQRCRFAEAGRRDRQRSSLSLNKTWPCLAECGC